MLVVNVKGSLKNQGVGVGVGRCMQGQEGIDKIVHKAV